MVFRCFKKKNTCLPEFQISVVVLKFCLVNLEILIPGGEGPQETLSLRIWGTDTKLIFDFPRGSVCKEFTCNTGDADRHRFSPWVGRIPWRRAWQPTPVFLPGESHGQRSLQGYSPWGGKELDTTKRVNHHHHQAVG